MSKYQYHKQSGGGNDLAYWIAAAVFLICLPPVGFFMIVLKLLGGKKHTGRTSGTTYTRRPESQPLGARTTSPQAVREPTAQDRSAQLAALGRKGRTLTIVGAVLTAVFLIATLSSAGDAFYWLLHGEPIWFLEDLMGLLPVLCFLGGGAGCLYVGLRRQKKVARFRQYLAMIGRRTSISLSSLSSATGASPAKVRDDLEDMLEENLFPNGYLDLGSGMLVISGDGLSDSPKEEAKQAQPPKEERPQDAVLDEIRTVNDAIDNPRLSQQIDRIGVITAKILDYQRQHPDKSPQLHSFLSYYLPTTLKILRAYAQLEDQEVAGENITAAMQRIEGMMDKVVEGFEKQLDQLFQGDAMDITTDVEVLERMLSKDGLSSTDGIRLEL